MPLFSTADDNCLTYAVTKVAGLPLLFVGDDFGQTDLEGANR